MSMLNMAAEIFLSKLGASGSGLNQQGVMGALQNLLPTSGEDLDLNGLISQFTQSGGLGDLVGSWLGDGGNDAIAPEQLGSVLGQGKIAEFASQLGLQEGEATNALSNTIPDLIDKSSEGGSLVGGLAGSVLGKLF